MGYHRSPQHGLGRGEGWCDDSGRGLPMHWTPLIAHRVLGGVMCEPMHLLSCKSLSKEMSGWL